MGWPDDPLPANVKALSLDVFDTALTRCWVRPEHVHLVCAPRLREAGLINLGNEAWLALRRRAEGQATQACGDDLARLSDVYALIGHELRWTQEQALAAQAIECAVEQASVWPVAPVRAAWQAAGSAGLARRFLSDMYLPADMIRQLLQHCGYEVALDDVWVSAERRASKSSGALFGRLSEALRLVPAAIMHAGDNPASDVDQARRAGVQAQHVSVAQARASELRVARSPQTPLLLRSLIAGAMRVARVNTPPPVQHPSDGDVNVFGRDHAGPLLTLYVWWLLHDAHKRQLRRLYFLARDGQVLWNIAQCLQAQGCAPGMQLRYLHGSRQAWFAASIVDWNEDQLFQILDEPHDHFSDLHKLAKRLGFDGAGALRGRWPQAAQACAAAKNNREVARALVRQVPAAEALAHTAGLRALALRYLAQEGLFDRTPAGIVDLGWRGRLQQTLARIVQDETAEIGAPCRPVLHGYYVALLNDELGASASTLLTGAVRGRTPMPAPAHLFEMLCEADHGTTRGYAAMPDGRVAPLFDPRCDPAVQAWGLQAYRRGVLAFATVFASGAQLLPPQMHERPVVESMFRALAKDWMHALPPEAARAFACMPTSYSSTHEGLHELAPSLPATDAWLRALTLGRLRLSGRRTPWLAGSLARSGKGRSLLAYAWLWDRATCLQRRWGRNAMPAVAA
jgi:hypothetical protein